jgi:hypothetical protein
MKTLIVGMIVLSVGLFAVAFDYTLDRMFAAVEVVEMASR